MRILGIETSCDETAASIVEISEKPVFNLSVLSNVVSSQAKIHTKYGGVVPEVAARRHTEVIIPVIEQAFSKAQVKDRQNHSLAKQVNLIAVTYGPGLVTSLCIGVEAAKFLSYVWKKPLIPVNHLAGHIYSNWLAPLDNKHPKRQFPVLCLVVSGGHTELILMKDFEKFKIVGQTLDDAAGEAFDKAAKILGLGYPGGPAIAAEAAKFPVSNFSNRDAGPADRMEQLLIELPRPMIGSPDFNFSFAGLKTAVLYKTKELLKKYSLEEFRSVMAREFEQAVVDVLAAKTITAAKKYQAKTVMLGGGVAANKELRRQLKEKIKNDLPDIQYLIPNIQFCTDNAAMIALAGYFKYQYMRAKKRKTALKTWQKIKVEPNLSL